MNVKDDFFSTGSLVVVNGQNTRFWKETMFGNSPLKDQYLTLYDIVNHTNVTVAHVLGSTPLNIGFRRVSIIRNKWDR
jgi:hypothetical protein